MRREEKLHAANAWDEGRAVRLAALGFKAIASTSAGAAWAAGKQDQRPRSCDLLESARAGLALPL